MYQIITKPYCNNKVAVKLVYSKSYIDILSAFNYKTYKIIYIFVKVLT